MLEIDDDTVIRRVNSAFDDIDDPPEHLITAARDAFGWRTADAELAELLFDSTRDALAGMRGSITDRRSFRYGAGETIMRVHLTEATLVLVLEPPISVICRILRDDGVDTYRTDDLGELVIDAPDLPFRIEVDLPSGTLVTPTVTS